MTDVTNFSIMAAADFVGGFMFGMTGDNHLVEIESCFTGGELMYHEIETGIADIKRGGWDNDVQAALEFGLVALQIPQALSSCHMAEDLAGIEAWAQIFTKPKQLAETVSKHYLFHKAEIKSDISALESDWKAGLSFKAGTDLADLLTIAVGPITVPSSANGVDLPPVASVPDFTAGLIFGFTGNDHRVELEGCMGDISPIVDDAKAFLDDLKHFNPLHVVEDIGEIVWILPDAVKSCGELEALQADLAVIETWAKQLESPAAAAKVASKNWLFHGVHIKSDVATEKADWAAKDYFGAGKATSDAMVTILPEGSVKASLEFEQ